MTTQTILEQAGIPLLLFVICMYYGLKLMILQDVSTIRGKNKEPVKDEKAYAKKGGALPEGGLCSGKAVRAWHHPNSPSPGFL